MQLGYSLGNLGKSIVWASFDSFLLFYLVSFCRFPPVWAGLLLGTLFVLDGCADVTVAWASDRRGGADRMRRLIGWGAPICGLAFWLTFGGYDLGGPALVIAAVILSRVGYTLCDIGHNTLMVRLATDQRSATRVSAMRLVCSSLGAMAVGLASAHLLNMPGGIAQERAIASGAAIGGALYFATLTLARIATRSLAATQRAPIRATFGALLGGLWHNGGYRSAVLTMMAQSTLVSLFVRALSFYGEAIAGEASWAGTALAAITAGQLLSLAGWMTLGRWLPPSRLLAAATGLAILALLAIRATALLPIGAASLALLGAALSGMNTAVWALLALSVKNSSDQHGEALPLGLFLAALKASAGAGTILLSALLWSHHQLPAVAAIGISLGMQKALIIIPVAGCALILLLHKRTASNNAATNTRL